tara:strand:+ start:65 stop:415 length:351 start_codon:yes stop_codon:yes gene_type:complete
MAVFPSIKPTYGEQITVKQDYITVKLGDGYQQRIVEGLPANKRLKTIQAKFEISQTDANTINTFLDAQFDAGMEAFDYTPSNATTALKVICIRRTETIPYLNRVNLSLTFEEVAEP